MARSACAPTPPGPEHSSESAQLPRTASYCATFAAAFLGNSRKSCFPASDTVVSAFPPPLLPRDAQRRRGMSPLPRTSSCPRGAAAGWFGTTTANGNSCPATAEPLKRVLFRDQQRQGAQTRPVILMNFSDSASVPDSLATVVSRENTGDGIKSAARCRCVCNRQGLTCKRI